MVVAKGVKSSQRKEEVVPDPGPRIGLAKFAGKRYLCQYSCDSGRSAFTTTRRYHLSATSG